MSWASAIYNHQLRNQEPPPQVETTEPELSGPYDELFPIDLLLLERADFLRNSLMKEHLDLMGQGDQPDWYLKWLTDNLPKEGVFSGKQGEKSWYYRQERGEAALKAALRHPNCPVDFFGALARETDHDLLHEMSLHRNSPLEIKDHEKVLMQALETMQRDPHSESLIREIGLLPKPLCRHDNQIGLYPQLSGTKAGCRQPESSLQSLAEFEAKEDQTPVQNEVSFRAQYSIEELGRLAASTTLLDRLIAAAHPATPCNQLELLATEEEPLLLYLLASNPSGPHETLLEKCLLAEMPLNSSLRWVGKELLHHGKISPAEEAILLDRIIQSRQGKPDNSYLLREIARLPQLSLRQMKILRSRALAENHRWETEWIPKELELLQHRFIRTRGSVKGTLVLHPKATAGFLHELLRNAPIESIDYLVKLIHTREDLTWEQKVEFTEFRDSLVRNQFCQELNKGKRPYYAHQVLALSWPEFKPWERGIKPGDLFGDTIQQSWSWRAMLVQNPGLPENWRQWLSKDGNRIVCHFASKPFKEE